MLRKGFFAAVLLLLLSGQSAPPVVLMPPSGNAGTTVDVTVPAIHETGDVSFEPAGLSVSNVRVDSRSQLTFRVQIPITAAPIAYTFVYRGTASAFAGARTVREPNAFHVTAPPQPVVRGISPRDGEAGASIPALITGIGFRAGANVSLGPGVSVIANVRDSGRIEATININASAAAGPRSVIVANTDGTSNASQTPPVTFTITAAARPEAPVVRSIRPEHITIGAPSVSATIRGINFRPGAIVTIAGARFLGENVSADGGSIAGQLMADAGAQPGQSPVRVRNADGSNNDAQQPPVMLAIDAPAAPVVRSITPSEVAAGSSNVVLVITGANFAAGLRTGTADGIMFDNVAVIDSSRIQASVTVAQATPAGPRAVIVRNPDGSNNAPQSPPVMLTIVAAPPGVAQPGAPRGRPSAPPPAGTPPATTPPGTPPAITPPTVTPPTIPPPEVPPVITPPGVPPAAPPPARPPEVVRPPTELLLGPRVDRVTPQKVSAGQKVKLQLDGKNFTPDMSVTFGSYVQVVGVPFITSPTTATVTVLIAPTAAAGVWPAVVRNRQGANSGPGGIAIGTTFVQQPVKPVEVITKKHFEQPTGTIVLDLPCDFDSTLIPENLKQYFCRDVPRLMDETVFAWHEENPGIADVFVLEIVDSKGKVLFSAQTKQPHFKMTAAALTTLPRIENPGPAQMAKGVNNNPVQSAASSIANTNAPPAAGAQVSTSKAPAAGKPMPSADILFAVLAPEHRSALPGEVRWRVRGLSRKISETTGFPLNELVDTEKSASRAIILPFPPNGLACDTTASKLGALVPRPLPSRTGKPRPKPCEGNSTNICSGVDYAEFSGDSYIDISRIPFDIGQAGEYGGYYLGFKNIFVDWGDGTEPEPLLVTGQFSKGKQTARHLRLVQPGGDEGQRLRHRYINGDPDAEYVEYRIRIYSLADPDVTPPHAIASVTAHETHAVGSLSQQGSGSQASTASGPAKPATPSASGTPSTNVMASIQASTYTVACTSVKVWNPWGEGEDAPLHLLKAAIVFPTDQEAAVAHVARPGTVSLDVRPAVPKDTKAPAPTPSGPVHAEAGQQAASMPPPGGDTQPIPSISDCSSAFRAALRLDYWGHGKVRVEWYLDDELLETTYVPNELPHVSTADAKNGAKPYYVPMKSALPAELQAVAHRLSARAFVALPKSGKATKPGATAAAAQPTSAEAVTLGNTQHSYSQVNQVFTATGMAAGTTRSVEASLPFIEMAIDTSGSEVTAPTRHYRVFDHRTQGLPCRLRYATQQTGTFTISDLGDFKSAGTGASQTWSGSGLLNLYLPAIDGNATAIQPVAIQFTGWKLGSNTSEEDVLDVLDGTLDAKRSDELSALNFPVKLTRLSLTPERLAIDGSVALREGMGLTTSSGSTLPQWTFAATPLAADGTFRASSSKATNGELAASGFVVSMTKSEIDFSRSDGNAPAQSCAPAKSGVTWQGILVDGTLNAPDVLQIANTPLLKDYEFAGWGIDGSGISLKLNDENYTRSISSGLKVNVKGFEMTVCSGTFGVPRFGIEIVNPPIIEKTIKGSITIDEGAGTHPNFGAVDVTNNWGNAEGHVTEAQFAYNEKAAGYAITLKSHFRFRVSGQQAYEHDFDGLLITTKGLVYGPDATNFFSVADAGTATVAGFPMQVTQLGAGNGEGGIIWVGFKGDIEVGKELALIEDREARFPLRGGTTGAHYNGDPVTLLASVDFYPLAGDGGEPEVQITDVDLQFGFPPGSDYVVVAAKCVWIRKGNDYMFAGKGALQIAGSYGIDAKLVFGRAEGDSYWLAQVGVNWGYMIPFGNSGFGMNEIHGGLGRSVPIGAFDYEDLTQITCDHSGAWLFSGGIGAGTLDGTTLYGKGTVTVKLGGADAGVRISIDAWVLTTDHNQSPHGRSCMQFAGGSFDGGSTINLNLFEILKVQAIATGPDVCTQAAIQVHFGGTSDWHIYIGQPDPALRIRLFLLIYEENGYMTVDPNGVKAGVGRYLNMKWTAVKIWKWSGWVKVSGSIEMYGAVYWDPVGFEGSLGGQVHASAGFDGPAGCCSIGFGVQLAFWAKALPIEVCGQLKLCFETPIKDFCVSPGLCL